uniref:Uncharacterized protein n=1 Tax=Eutreptiella gymnastica TaxID=73025 RepID=A0A7S1J0Y8_9EUGL|mmetsp:Transcript_58919/g.105069  ORF Transcript_58919/g.105069 Transcript_58919/m.105069 type:complete len:221 (+) Transcript_58919:168-830(+)
MNFPTVAYPDVPQECKVALVNFSHRKRHWLVHTVRPFFKGDNKRSAHAVKTMLPFLFPKARYIFYGDAKCHGLGGKFSGRARKYLPGASLLLVRHPDHKVRTVEGEFEATIQLMTLRKEPRSVFQDIKRLKSRYMSLGYNMSRTHVLADTMCVAWTNDGAARDMACHWNCEVAKWSMREQLSLDFALKSTPSIHGRYRFMEYKWAHDEPKPKDSQRPLGM